MKRREILKIIGLSGIGMVSANSLIAMFNKMDDDNLNQFKNIINKALENSWDTLPLGKLISLIGLEFLGTPYVAGTLDESDVEKCIPDLLRLDCVTFVENVLGIARILKRHKTEYKDLINEITFTRYRSGRLTDYTSRLHYTADWILDNEKKGVVREISNEYGGKKISFNCFFMSKNSDKYKFLKNNPGFVSIIKNQEDYINSKKYYYIPKNKIIAIENFIYTGDIIAITTSIAGLDYAHLGFAYRDEFSGDVKFLHASSNKKKVVVEDNLSNYLAGIEKDTGISIVRPQEF